MTVCPKCGAKQLMEMTLGPKTKKVVCHKCGFTEMRDDRNLPLLTEVPSSPTSSLLG